MGASLRAELFDATLFYVALTDRTPCVGCLYFSGPEAEQSAYFLAERVRYLPSELAKALVVESKDAASRVMALLALGLGGRSVQVESLPLHAADPRVRH